MDRLKWAISPRKKLQSLFFIFRSFDIVARKQLQLRVHWEIFKKVKTSHEYTCRIARWIVLPVEISQISFRDSNQCTSPGVRCKTEIVMQ